MRVSGFRAGLLAIAGSSMLLLAGSPAWAQQDSTPSSGQGGDQSSSAETGTQNAPGPAGGVEAYRFPSSTPARSFFVPRFTVQQLYDTNTGYATSSSAGESDGISSISGGFSLQSIGRVSTFSLDESTQGLIYFQQTQPNSVIEQFDASEKITLRRGNLLFGENFSYLPNSAFGLGGLGYLGGGVSGYSGVGGVNSFNPSQIPTQTIGSTNVSQISQTCLFQGQYLINGSSSLNGFVTAGFLHFFGGDLLNSRTLTARIGYDKSLTARDTLSFSYQATNEAYSSDISGFTTHYIHMGYRRILTGRLQAYIAAGPSITHFNPMPGQTTVMGSANQVSWSLNASLDYLLHNGSLGAAYTHGTGGGSGYLVGSEQDQFTGTFSHTISRVWKVSLTGGYSHNGALEQTTPAGGNSNVGFDYWYAGGSLSRPLGRYSSVSFSYNASEQTSNATTCVAGVPCGPIALVQVVGVTFNWSTRPYSIE
ncbi:MAG TPA: hypothetical protein VMV61_07725 [Patescibacteria group bacterium]|nr:hypothetical protein [Patescibacteria group bacterium]